MCLHRTDALHAALAHVADGNVVHHSGMGPMEGYAWADDGGHMFQAEQDALSLLLHAGLTGIGAHSVDGNPVRTTRSGEQRLVEWNAAVSWKAAA